MFKVNTNPTFTHTVEVRTPVDGGHKTETIKATYKLLSDEETMMFDTRKPEGMKDFLRAVLIKLDDLVDEKDKPLPYNDELRDLIIALPHARNGLFNGYVNGIAGGRLGN